MEPQKKAREKKHQLDISNHLLKTDYILLSSWQKRPMETPNKKVHCEGYLLLFTN